MLLNLSSDFFSFFGKMLVLYLIPLVIVSFNRLLKFIMDFSIHCENKLISYLTPFKTFLDFIAGSLWILFLSIVEGTVIMVAFDLFLLSHGGQSLFPLDQHFNFYDRRKLQTIEPALQLFREMYMFIYMSIVGSITILYTERYIGKTAAYLCFGIFSLLCLIIETVWYDLHRFRDGVDNGYTFIEKGDGGFTFV